jgi:hypothetical protein
MKTAKPSKVDAPTTGLGETIEEITATCNALRATLAKAIGVKKLTPEQDEAAFRYGVAERRRRKLAKKVGSED